MDSTCKISLLLIFNMTYLTLLKLSFTILFDKSLLYKRINSDKTKLTQGVTYVSNILYTFVRISMYEKKIEKNDVLLFEIYLLMLYCSLLLIYLLTNSPYISIFSQLVDSVVG